MSLCTELKREAKFAASDRTVWFWLMIVLCLSIITVSFGLAEVEQQNSTIKNLIDADQQDRTDVSKKLKDWGSAAYYNFHLTYDPPSDFAFSAMGLRDAQPWKHRVRMLAFEGQIYERDVGNPSVALIGRFDFAFLAAFIIPLILIMLLYDLRTSEITAGRYNLLEATLGKTFRFWLLRASIRSGTLFLCLVVPLIVAGIATGTSLEKLISAALFIFLYLVFWTLVCFWVASWRKHGSVILLSLIMIWLATAVIIPAGARLVIDRMVAIPSGAEILLLQREAVNDAWDLPREETMKAFFDRHPEWADYERTDSAFEWQWYYAFQQVGDQKTESLSKAYLNGRLERDRLASWVALLAPPALLERAMQSLAQTNFKSSIEYELKVRDYHKALRDYYYPKFFRNRSFDKSLLKNLPAYKPDQ